VAFSCFILDVFLPDYGCAATETCSIVAMKTHVFMHLFYVSGLAGIVQSGAWCAVWHL
jgi:hypothetical protein